MTAAAIIELITGILKFPHEVLALVRLLQGTPDAQKQDVMKAIEAASVNFQKTGRPTWDG